VTFGVPATSHIDLAVYDVAGRFVARLYDGEVPAGYHRAVWAGVNEAGDAVASGVYFCRMRAAGESRSIKMTLLK
jgi:flagellar hook assembly protein FlgD